MSKKPGKLSKGSNLPIRIGISACLLGERVRYDGGHKLDLFITRTLGKHIECVPICPEVEWGLDTPREPMRLERRSVGIHRVTIESRCDFTDPMDEVAAARAEALAAENLCGHIFKSGSPSCGISRLRVCGSRGKVPWTAPVNLIKRFVRRCDISWIAGQACLNPHPSELALRNSGCLQSFQ